MFVTAKLTGKIQAIKLTKEVVAEKGDFLLIGENDSITVMSAAEFSRWFTVPNGKTQSTTKPQRAKRGTSGRKRSAINPDGAICDPNTNSPYKRVLQAFGPKHNGGYLENLSRNKIVEILNMSKENVSPALSDLHHSGYVSVKHFGIKDNRYSITEQGIAMLRKIAERANEKKNPPLIKAVG